MLSLTIIIIILTCGFSFLCFNSSSNFENALLVPYKINHQNEYWRFFTSIFSHGDEMHLIFNMITLYSFGEIIEQFFLKQYPGFGKILFILFYLTTGIFASIYPYFKHKDNPNYRALGASGAVSALIFCFILLAPDAKLSLMFIPIPLPAWVFGLAYMAFEIYGHRQNRGGIAHDAHIGGAIFGIVFTILLFPKHILSIIQSYF